MTQLCQKDMRTKFFSYQYYWLYLVSLLGSICIHASHIDDEQKYDDEQQYEKSNLLILSYDEEGVNQVLSTYGFRKKVEQKDYEKNPKKLTKVTEYKAYTWLKNPSDLLSIVKNKKFETAMLYIIINMKEEYTNDEKETIQHIIKACYICWLQTGKTKCSFLYTYSASTSPFRPIAALMKEMYEQKQISSEFYNIYNSQENPRWIDIKTSSASPKLPGLFMDKNTIHLPSIFCLQQANTSQKELLLNGISNDYKTHNTTAHYTLYSDANGPFYITHTDSFQQTIADCLQCYGICQLDIQIQKQYTNTIKQIQTYSPWFKENHVNRKSMNFFTLKEGVIRYPFEEGSFEELKLIVEHFDKDPIASTFVHNVIGKLGDNNDLVRVEKELQPYLAIEDFSENILLKLSKIKSLEQVPSTSQRTLTSEQKTGIILLVLLVGLWAYYQDIEQTYEAPVYPTISKAIANLKTIITPQSPEKQPNKPPLGIIITVLLLLIFGVYMVSRNKQHTHSTT